jgi:adenosine deaminase
MDAAILPEKYRFDPRIFSHLTMLTTSELSFFTKLPKVVLHEHLDGNLRPATLLALCQQRGLDLPAHTPEALAQWIFNQANSGSLEQYVASFALTVAAMASPEACERVAFEAVQDCAADGAVLIELRMAPLLLEPHGMSGDDAVSAMLAGLKRGSAATGVPAGLIVCGMRHEAPERVIKSAELATRFAGRGVIGFDLAGAEKGFPVGLHAKALALAKEAGLGMTLHAGEADVGGRVLEAINLGATRIGHGVQIAVSAPGGEAAKERMAQAAHSGVHFEVCPTSNVHTGAWLHISTHPLKAMLAAGLSCSVQADNRMVSSTTQSAELHTAYQRIGISLDVLHQGMLQAAQASFLPEPDKAQAIEKIIQHAGVALSLASAPGCHTSRA